MEKEGRRDVSMGKNEGRNGRRLDDGRLNRK